MAGTNAAGSTPWPGGIISLNEVAGGLVAAEVPHVEAGEHGG